MKKQRVPRTPQVADRAQLNVNGTQIELPVVVGTEGERGIDIAPCAPRPAT